MHSDALAYYAAHGAALFPIPAGEKHGHLVPSFKHDHSRDPAQWAAWQQQHPGCNFGVVAFASHWIILDTDTSGGEEGRSEAWAMRSELFRAWGMNPETLPHCQSARGGWHDYFQVPAHIDAASLRQPDAIKKRINVRCIGYTVAAGSQFEGQPYLIFPNAPAPHPAPDALVKHCTRAAPRIVSTGVTGSRDKGDVAALLVWMNEHGAFEAYEDWFAAGMALKIEYGDDGLGLWELTFDNTVTPSVAETKWASFASEPTSESITLNSLLDRAHKLGWKGSIRRSTSAMFDGVAQLAASTGASLSSGMPMLAGQEELTRIATPRLQDFLTATPPCLAHDLRLPEAMSGHGLYSLLNDSIARVFSLLGKRGQSRRFISPLSVLSVAHEEIFRAVCDRALSAGHTLPLKQIKQAALNLTEEVQRITVTFDKWEYDPKSGRVEADNPDNLATLLGMLGLEIRFNAWLEIIEIQGTSDADFLYPAWTYLDDVFVAKLITRAKRTKTRFCMGKDFCWETLTSLAHKNTVDPALEHLATLQQEWDGTPRLSGWLQQVAGAPDDAYHCAVSSSIFGGMVRRIRQPGCKHDLMPVLFGPQGTGKSTVAKVIADMGQSSLQEINRRSTEFFSDEVLLGDASKELVLSLAGKCLVEIGEMGQRNSANLDHVKAMLSRQVDRGRTAYARSVTKRPRRNVFFGTVNGDTPLQDTSGNRRFLPVAVPIELNLLWLSENIRQLIGEACAAEAKGETFELPREVWGAAEQHQEAARSVSDVEVRLQTWFAETPFTAASFVATEDLVELSEAAGWKNMHTFRNGVLKRLGFKEVQPYIGGVRTRGWQRGAGKAEAVTRYVIGKAADGRPRVTIRAGSASMPPLPY